MARRLAVAAGRTSGGSRSRLAATPLPLRGPTFTVEQLATALEAGEQAKSGLVTGDLSDAAVRRTKGMSYAKLCDLAEALTFRRSLVAVG